MARTQSKAKPITAAQIKRIHTIISILKVSDDNYRAVLDSRFGVTTCKALTITQAKSFLDELEELSRKMCNEQYQARQEADRQKAEEESRRAAESRPKKFDDLDNRPGMASGAQLRKIEAMWQDISIIPEAEPRARALRRFVLRITGCMGLRFLTDEDAGKVLNALTAMERRERQNGKNAKN